MATRKSSSKAKRDAVAPPTPSQAQESAADTLGKRVEAAVMGLDRIHRLHFKVAQAIEDDKRNDASLFLDLIAEVAMLHGKRLDITARTGLFDEDDVPTEAANG